MIRVVVLGAGFAGIAAAKSLLKTTERSEVQIILIDRNSYHLFTPSLYELATAEETVKNVCIPLSEIFPRGVELIRGQVEKIDTENREIIYKSHSELFENSRIAYDYLIIALGSESAYYKTPGLKENSIPFKTLEDALKIRDMIKIKEKARIVIGGGGFSGTELACEMVRHKRKGAELTIIQGSERLLKELDKKISQRAEKRLTAPNVRIAYGGRIKRVDKDYVYTDSSKYPYDVLIWTGGVNANSIETNFEKDERGDLVVNDKLKVKNLENIFAAGDIAKGYPWVAQIAEEEGKLAGENVANLIKGNPLKNYKFRHLGYVVPLGGRYAAAQLGKIIFVGLLGWILEQFIFLKYLLRILPLNKAFKRWNKFEMYLVK